jgi:hypothetical protein
MAMIMKKGENTNQEKTTIVEAIAKQIPQFPNGCFYDSTTIAAHRAICRELMEEAYENNNTKELQWIVSSAADYITRERAKPQVKKGVVAPYVFTEKEQWIVSCAAAFYALYRAKHPSSFPTTEAEMVEFYRSIAYRLQSQSKE